MFLEGPRGPEADPALMRSLSRVSPSTLGHLRDFGFMRGLHPNMDRMKIVGPAVTVRIAYPDSTAVHCALDAVKEGDVVVVEQLGDANRACWGGVITYAAHVRGVVGVIIDGPVTDVREIADIGMPMYFRSVTALTGRLLGVEGAINVPIMAGGAAVRPGDIIFADENGVAVLSAEDASRLEPLLATKEAGELVTKSKLDDGASLADLSGARELFEAGRSQASDH